MRTLYHLWLSPACRKVRLVLAEKHLAFTLEVEPVWQRRRAFLALNPAGEVPVLIEPDERVLADATAIAEYLDEVAPEPNLLGATPEARAETRRLVAWFDRKFDAEVTANLVGEKIVKRLSGVGQPDSGAIRAGQANIHTHLDYIGYLADRRLWLAGNCLTLADLTAAAHLSCVDYLGSVPWEGHPGAKEWYARIKSRPSFRSLLADSVPGMPPPPAYADLDF
ncbi:MAG: glutathione S-transferase family protein [Rhodospirillales bacterium]|nr:MAG: glutathione S-transferase family protein [Rhodospirillales bacterium]